MKKGFTLIELLAVIVILAVIALIATPTITDIIEKARKGGAESSALGWIDAIEKQSMVNELSDANKIDVNGRYSVSELISKGVKVKGDAPSSGYVAFTNGNVSSSTLCIGKYKVVIENDKVKSSTKENNCVVDNSYPSVVYSRVSGGTHVGYPIDAGVVLNNKIVYTYSNIEYPCNSSEECSILLCSSNNQNCVAQSFTTPNLDYKLTPDSNWNYYLKYSLSSSGIIEEIEMCGKYNGREFCLKRSEDGSKFEQNKNLLLNTFGSEYCSVYDSSVDCRVEGITANIYDNGGVIMDGDSSRCLLYSHGTAACRIEYNT